VGDKGFRWALGRAGFSRRIRQTVCCFFQEGCFVSIVRVGLSEKENFAEGYEAIFGKKSQTAKKAPASKGAKAKASTGSKKKKSKKK
jgi:hypothetical protein